MIPRRRLLLFDNTFSPLDLFKAGENGAWYDPSDISSLWQSSNGTTQVTAVGDPIGRISDKSGKGNHAIQATSAARPVWNNISSTVGFSTKNSYRIYHDFVDDLLKWTGTTGNYYIAVVTISGVQFYQAYLTQTTGGIPINDFIGMVILNRDFSTTERANITSYFAKKLDGLNNTQYLFECNTTSYIGRGGTCTGTLSWTFGDGTVYNTMFTATETTVKRETLQFICTNTALSIFSCQSNQLTGSIPSLTANTALTQCYYNNNQLTGSIPSLTTNTLLTIFDTHSNQLTGTIPSLTTNTALSTFSCYLNQLTGSIPSLTTNTALSIFSCQSNQLTGSIPSLTANTALTQCYCNNNQLTGSIPSLTANTALSIFYCYVNQLTGTIPSLTANTVLSQFSCYTNQLTGTIPDLSANTVLITFDAHNNLLTDYAGGTVSNTVGNFQAQNNLLIESAINAILAAFVAANKTTGTRVLNLGGTGNAAPTGQGIVDKATLVSRGWTVTTN